MRYNIAAQDTKIDSAVSRAVSWLLVDSNVNGSSNLEQAHRLIGLGAARAYYSGQSIASTIQTKMDSVGAALRSRQRPDGGWGANTGGASDSMVTAQVGTALDYLNPPAKDPVVQNAIRYLLARQQGDGSWISETGIFSTRLAATTWVEAWLPIALERLGGIDTDVTIATPNNVTLAKPSIAPTSTTANAQGGTTYLWKLQSVTSAGRDINFDLTFTDLGVGENRAAASNAFLTFNNSFTQSPQNAPIAIPKLLGSAFLELSVATDAANYPALSPVVISSLIKNTGLTTNSGSVGLSIYSAADNVLVADLGNYPFSGLAAGAQLTLPAQWNTETTAPGPYYVLGTLLDSQGNNIGLSKATFSIIGNGGTSLAGKIATDKPTYQPYDVVRIADRISNLTQNQALDGLTAVTTVSKPDGTVVFTRSSLLSQLIAGANQDLNYTLSLSGAAAGTYKASLSVLNGSGVQSAYAETFFTVDTSSISGSGLTGTIIAEPKLVPLGDAVLLSSSAVNLGNADLSNVLIKTTIIDPVAQTVVAEWPETVTLTQQQTYNIARSWPTQGSVGQSYVAVLTALVGGKTITLAQDSFTLTEPPVKLDVTQGRLAQSRVLVLAACSGTSSSSDSDDSDDSDDKEYSSGEYSSKEYSDGEHSDSEYDKDGSSSTTCAAKRAVAIAGYLTSRGIKHLVTSDEKVFRKAMRGGYYNVYWLSGGSSELTNDIEEELAEAVFRGDSLILDNLSGTRATSIDQVAGTSYNGNLSSSSLKAKTTGTLFPVATRSTVGLPTSLKLTSGQVQANFVTSSDSGSEEESDSKEESESNEYSSSSSAYPAIVSNQYGAGRAIIYGFDVVSSLQTTAGWNSVFDTALDYLKPPIVISLSGGGFVPVLTTIRNQAKAVDLEVILTAPPGGYIEKTLPIATVDATGRPVWRITLPEAGKAELLAGLRLPLKNGTAILSTTINSIRNGQVIPYNNYSIAFTVKTASTRNTELVNGLKALSISNSYDRSYRDSAVYYLNQAGPLLNGTSSQLNTAVNYLVDAAKYLARISTINVSRYRTDTDLVIQEVQFKWFKLQP